MVIGYKRKSKEPRRGGDDGGKSQREQGHSKREGGEPLGGWRKMKTEREREKPGSFGRATVERKRKGREEERLRRGLSEQGGICG